MLYPIAPMQNFQQTWENTKPAVREFFCRLNKLDSVYIRYKWESLPEEVKNQFIIFETILK